MPPYSRQRSDEDPLVASRRSTIKHRAASTSGGMIDERQSRWMERLPPASAVATMFRRSVTGAGKTAAATPSVLRTTHDRLQWVLDCDPTGSLRPALRILAASTATVLGGLALLVALGSAYGVDGWAGTVPAIASAETAVVETVRDAIPGASESDSDTSRLAVDIPSEYLALYQDAAQRCGMDWEVLAGVGSVETNHGRSKAPGVHSGANFAGASGPMQFMAPTWAAYGVDGNGDGKKNVYEPADAINGAANYLCANGAGSASSLDNALWHYNRDSAYVANVKSVADDYRQHSYAAPLKEGTVELAAMTEPHHDYPAVDIALPEGTPVHAVHGGRVTLVDEARCGSGVSIKGNDGATYLYCHASSRSVRSGQKVEAGEQIMKSGGAPGARGSGSSSGPHLHLQIEAGSRKICPQGLIEAWSEGRFEVPSKAKSSGCIS